MFDAAPLLIPTIELSKSAFIALNYVIVGMFLLMNVYITYQILQAYGPILWSLFTGDQTAPISGDVSTGLSLSSETLNTFGFVLMVLGGLLTLSIFGLVFGIPLFMIGWDIRQRTAEQQEASTL